jgi:hypothetical protein
MQHLRNPIIIILLIISIYSSSCKPKVGTLTGNVFWKYNDYVGNKPDAGATAYLLTTDTTKEAISATCDVQGNYKIENLPVGKYLLIVKSNNANSNGEWTCYDLVTFREKYSKYLGFDLKKIDPVLCDSIDVYKSLKDTAYSLLDKDVSSFKALDRVGAADKNYNNAIQRLLSKIPDNMRIYTTGLARPFNNKTDMQEIEIKPNQTTNIITDFGTTYYAH